MPLITKPTTDDFAAMEALTRSDAGRMLISRITREVESIKTNMMSMHDADRMRQLQGGAMALSGLLDEIAGSHDALRKAG